MSIIHKEPHPQAGQRVHLKDGKFFDLQDWADRVFGKSWGRMAMQGNSIAKHYRARVLGDRLPADNNVVYGTTIGSYAVLVHVSEIA